MQQQQQHTHVSRPRAIFSVECTPLCVECTPSCVEWQARAAAGGLRAVSRRKDGALDHARDQGCSQVGILRVWGCILGGLMSDRWGQQDIAVGVLQDIGAAHAAGDA